MEHLRKKLTVSTIAKYFLSYLIIISVLITGFFFIIRRQITDNYFSYRSQQAQNQLDSLAEQLREDVVLLSRIDSAIISDMEVIEGRYKEASAHSYQALQELREYDATAKLISSVVYMPKRTNIPLSTELMVKYTDGLFYITDSSLRTVAFDPEPYFDASFGQLVFISNEATRHLLYFPAISTRANYIFFYILDTNDLQQQLKGILSEETLSAVLMDEKGQLVAGVNSELLLPYLNAQTLETGVRQTDESNFLCVRGDIRNGFSMASLVSRDFIASQINASFASSYLALVMLSIVGFLLILLAMRITYLPLHRLTKKVIPDADSRKGYINQLESAFSDAECQNRLLKDKLENYRRSMQKSLLDALVITQYPGTDSPLSDIDQLFDRSAGNKLFVIRMAAPDGALPWDEIQRSIAESLPDRGACILLEPKVDSAVFLINYAGDAQNKEEILKALCSRFYEEQGYLSAISNGSESPLDIPALYENAQYAGSAWPQTPVAEFAALPPASPSFVYPHESLDCLSEKLEKNDYPAAKQIAETILDSTGRYVTGEGSVENFFVQCVLIDVLTVLTNHMNLSHIKFYDYSSLYFETLHDCRSCPYKEKADHIRHNIGKLIDFCHETITERRITAAPLIQYVEDNYCKPDFSIAVLADAFHVSITYMSQLFRKDLNVYFSDYLWSKRQNKAQELLRSSDMSIDEISLAVGYLNTSSFRRKFKQELGMTPSQYRELYAQDSEQP